MEFLHFVTVVGLRVALLKIGKANEARSELLKSCEEILLSALAEPENLAAFNRFQSLRVKSNVEWILCFHGDGGCLIELTHDSLDLELLLGVM